MGTTCTRTRKARRSRITGRSLPPSAALPSSRSSGAVPIIGIGHQTGADSKAESVQANDSKESGSDASAKDGSKSKEKSHIHDWSITYKTVHHDAVTHTEHVAPVYQNLTTYHTVCNECKQVIDGKADDHIKQTGHSGYSTNVPITDEVMVSEGYDKQVTDTPAYDETVIDKLVCTTCGATKDAPQATSDAAK